MRETVHRLCVALAVLAGATTLEGCGGGEATTPSPTLGPGPTPGPGPPTPVPTPGPPTPAPTPGPPTPAPTPEPPAPAGKQRLHVVLRMDDIQYGWLTGVQKSVVEWALTNKIKFNFGIISGPDPNGQVWPTTCSESPTDTGCDDEVVSAMYKAYADNNVRGSSVASSQYIEIFDHAWDHKGWATMSEAARAQDLTKSTQALRAAFPKASINTFVPPENIATSSTVTQIKASGLSILSSQGTLGCTKGWKGEPNRYNYEYAPCQPSGGGGAGDWFCIPSKDTYITNDGYQKLSEGVFSTPTGSANSLFNNVAQGLEVEDVVGSAASCGCVGATCSIIGSAINNAKKSNGVLWTVMMMHPQTKFLSSQSYTEWLDAALKALRALEQYDVRFIHFQDLVALRAPSVQAVVV